VHFGPVEGERQHTVVAELAPQSLGGDGDLLVS
jgi:hypothetical protein